MPSITYHLVAEPYYESTNASEAYTGPFCRDGLAQLSPGLRVE